MTWPRESGATCFWARCRTLPRNTAGLRRLPSIDGDSVQHRCNTAGRTFGIRSAGGRTGRQAITAPSGGDPGAGCGHRAAGLRHGRPHKPPGGVAGAIGARRRRRDPGPPRGPRRRGRRTAWPVAVGLGTRAAGPMGPRRLRRESAPADQAAMQHRRRNRQRTVRRAAALSDLRAWV